MTRKEFMEELAARLGRLPQAEREAALAYYEEYFDEAGPEKEYEVIRELGSPQAVASRILADYAIKVARAAPHNPGKGFSAIWFVLLAILAAPIALPLVFALMGGAIAVVATVFAVGVAAVGLIIGGIALFFGGFTSLFATPAAALVLFGIAFLLWGAGKLVFELMGAVLGLLGGFLSWLFGRPRGGRYGR